MGKGRPDWIEGRESLSKCVRFWPHKIKGEGHFIALLRKNEDVKIVPKKGLAGVVEKNTEKLWTDFSESIFRAIPEGILQVYGSNIHIIPEGLPDIRGLNIVRTGVQLGSIEKNRFEPSQALVMASKIDDFKNVLDLKAESQDVIKYLKGETLMVEGKKGWTAVCVDGYPLGWAKQGEGVLKNMYPKAWRKMG
jgi:NOL1/NOP2/fmu family ribosome biogenesis protein